MKNKLTLILAAQAVSLAFAPMTDAALLRFVWGGGGDGVTFTDPSNWAVFEAGTGSNLPGDIVDSGDTTNVILQTGGTATTTVSSPFTPANPFDILIVRSGHTLNIQSDFDLSGIPTRLGQTGTGSTLNHTAGAFSTSLLQVGNGADGTYNLSGSGTVTAGSLSISSGSTVNLNGGAFTMPKVSPGNNVGYTIDGTLEISGGTHIFNERLFGSGTIRVIGDDADIRFHQIGGSGQDFEFVLDSTGVSGLVGGGPGIGSSGAGPYWVLNGSTLNVDASAFYGNQTFTLFDTVDTVNSFFDTGDITVTGAGSENGMGVGWNLQQYVSGGRNLVELTVYIPEPSSAVLLGIGGLALAFRRRK